MTSDPTDPAAPQRLIDMFWETIPSTWKLVRNQLHATAMEAFDVTEEQWHILRHIRKGAQSVSELAQIKLITRSAVSQSIDLLVEKGLVARTQTSQDRRFVQLTLTEVGNNLLNSIFLINRDWMMQKMAALSQAEIETAIRGMSILKQVFDQ
jgi:DNA-binding MarR family transcriptional regulator